MTTDNRSTSQTALDDYLQAIGELQTRVLTGQRTKLLEAAARMAPLSDLALDNGGRPGDAILDLEGSPWPVAPSSTVICALLWNSLVVETAACFSSPVLNLPSLQVSTSPAPLSTTRLSWISGARPISTYR